MSNMCTQLAKNGKIMLYKYFPKFLLPSFYLPIYSSMYIDLNV